MAITHSTKNSGYYKELEAPKREQYLSLARESTIHAIDNIYYTVFVNGDSKDNQPLGLLDLLNELEVNKALAMKIREPIELENGLYYLLKSYHNYSYCVSNPDIYDVFICKGLPNDQTPRIMVQIRAFGLWTRGVDSVLNESYKKVESLLTLYSCTVDWCRESRIDYCFHTNAISNVDSVIERDRRKKVKNLFTNLKRYVVHGETEEEEDGTIHKDDYICYGRIKSNNIRARIYDKGKEVIEQGYKAFFFKIWFDKKLISYYDKWCMEYAFPYKNMDYLYKAALAFYVEHGTDPVRVKEYSDVLSNPKITLDQLRKLAKKHMPKVTSILNIEYETKRKFYYYSDHFINGFKLSDERGNISKPMERIYKILEYRDVFLNYLTSRSLSFHKGKNVKDKDGDYVYLPWWNRLRNTKHDGKNINIKLLREYSQAMDKRAVQKRAINTLASIAVYDDRLETGFVEDISDLLADVSDNKAHKMGLSIVDENGNSIEDFYGPMISDYAHTKAKKEMLLKNRKARQSQLAKQSAKQTQQPTNTLPDDEREAIMARRELWNQFKQFIKDNELKSVIELTVLAEEDMSTDTPVPEEWHDI